MYSSKNNNPNRKSWFSTEEFLRYRERVYRHHVLEETHNSIKSKKKVSLKTQLLQAGFTTEEVQSIMYQVECGRTLDSAMQSIL